MLCGLIDQLPGGIHLLNGNDLDSEPPVFQVGVTTRAHELAHWVSLPTGVSEPESLPANDSAEIDADLNDLFHESATTQTDLSTIVSRETLTGLQRANTSLAPWFALAEQKDGLSVERHSYSITNGILVLYWRDMYTSDGADFTQILVPSQLRAKLLHVAHDIPASGHLGAKKTLDRLLKHFYWPGINSSVRVYFRTCGICQRLGKGVSSSRAPLVNLPVISEPFSRLTMDIVGPLSACVKFWQSIYFDRD